MKPDLIALTLFGNGLGFAGLWLMRWHARVWQQQSADPQLERGLKRHYAGQYRRRMQSSGLLAAIGFLLNLSNEFLFPWQRMPGLFAVYVGLLLILLIWLMLLALADLAGNRVVHGLALARLKDQQRQLEQSLAEFRQQKSASEQPPRPPADWN